MRNLIPYAFLAVGMALVLFVALPAVTEGIANTLSTICSALEKGHAPS